MIFNSFYTSYSYFCKQYIQFFLCVAFLLAWWSGKNARPLLRQLLQIFMKMKLQGVYFAIIQQSVNSFLGLVWGKMLRHNLLSGNLQCVNFLIFGPYTFQKASHSADWLYFFLSFCLKEWCGKFCNPCWACGQSNLVHRN